MKVSDLSPHPGNPRRITDAELRRLRKTIELYGDLSGIVFNRKTKRLVGGHQRGKVLPVDAEIVISDKRKSPDKTGTVAEGYIVAYGTRYSYREVEWDEAREMAANIAANKSGGMFDDKALADWLLDLDSKNIDIEETGFSAQEFEDLCAPYRDMPEEKLDSDEDEDQEPPEEPEKLSGKAHLINSDCLKALKTFPSDSLDSVVTDPPYGFAFMGKKWDYELPSQDIWKEIYRVLKPGGHLLAFGGPRTYHRLACGVEDAGFEIRDQLQWLFGSGFPKSLDISKAIDKAAGVEREVVGKNTNHRTLKPTNTMVGEPHSGDGSITTPTTPTTPEAHQWSGWGTALKPANEPIVLARKPLSENTVAANVLKWGTGGLNIEACRIATTDDTHRLFEPGEWEGDSGYKTVRSQQTITGGSASGRFPANLILDETAAKMLDAQVKGRMPAPAGNKNPSRIGHGNNVKFNDAVDVADASRFQLGGDPEKASRFFYVAKASKSERNMHCGELEDRDTHRLGSGVGRTDGENSDNTRPAKDKNHHPTVKPVSLMRYLIKLVTQPGGLILDPFMGSGSTGVAALQAEFKFIGIEREKEYFEICKKRLNYAHNKTEMFNAK